MQKFKNVWGLLIIMGNSPALPGREICKFDKCGILRDLAQHKEVKVWEGHLMPDHVHMLLSILPKFQVLYEFQKGGNEMMKVVDAA